LPKDNGATVNASLCAEQLANLKAEHGTVIERLRGGFVAE